jgi:hypothetical protein
MIHFYFNNETEHINDGVWAKCRFGMTAGLSVQSHAVFIEQLLPASTVVAYSEMCGSGGRRCEHEPAL